MTKVQLQRAIKEAIIKGIQRNGERIFNTSQQTELCFCPVDTGMLLRSGYVKKLRNGVEIGYHANYAATVETGSPSRPITGDQTVHVREYTRKDGRTVQAHDVTYHNKRVIGFRPKHSKFERGEKIFRVISEEKERQGQWFLKRSLLKEIKYLPEDFEFFLKQIK